MYAPGRMWGEVERGGRRTYGRTGADRVRTKRAWLQLLAVTHSLHKHRSNLLVHRREYPEFFQILKSVLQRQETHLWTNQFPLPRPSSMQGNISNAGSQLESL